MERPSSTVNSGASGAPALARGLGILEMLASRQEGASLAEISTALGTPKNSTMRLLQTLVEAGYLRRQESPQIYQLTDRLLQIAQPHERDVSLVENSLAAMRDLRDRVGETVQLGIPIGDEGVIIEKLESTAAIRIGVKIGLRFALHNNAPGKILLSYRPDAEREATIKRIKLSRFTERTITTQKALRAECERVLENGYGEDWGEGAEGIHCIAAPIRDRFHQLIGTIWVSGIAGRMPKESFPDVGKEVIDAATQIEQRIQS